MRIASKWRDWGVGVPEVTFDGVHWGADTRCLGASVPSKVTPVTPGRVEARATRRTASPALEGV